MPVNERIRLYERALGDWKIHECLGQGGFGAVYKIVRNQMLLQEECALKVINLIEGQGRFELLSSARKNEYIRIRDDCSGKALEEVRMMYSLRGHTNIVDYLDCKFQDWSDGMGFGRDLLIRMELLSDLDKFKKNKKNFTEKEIIQIGSDICSALARCRKTDNFIHRDIKPGNIFVNKNGDYKLGDFGISKIVENIPGNMARTQIGTMAYMAPEQLLSAGYDNRVDIYSLGLVLYELGNNYCLPFSTNGMPNQAGVARRMQGEAFPAPNKVSSELAGVILKACAYKPENRYQTPESFRDALMAIGKPKYNYQPVIPELKKPSPTKPAVSLAEKSDPNRKDDFNHIKQMADKGDLQAQTELGNYYFKSGPNHDYSEAFRWYLKAANKNHAPAQNKLGQMYEWGDGVAKNLTEAVRWYRKAAEQNYVKAQLNIYYMYSQCQSEKVYSGIEKAEAEKWLKKAANLGDKYAQYSLGAYCKQEKNNTEALKWMKKATEQNLATALIELGDWYYNGTIVARDYSEAVRLYRNAVEAKWPTTYIASQAAKKLGDCYKYGHGVVQSPTLAEYWYQKSKEYDKH